MPLRICAHIWVEAPFSSRFMTKKNSVNPRTKPKCVWIRAALISKKNFGTFQRLFYRSFCSITSVVVIRNVVNLFDLLTSPNSQLEFLRKIDYSPKPFKRLIITIRINTSIVSSCSYIKKTVRTCDYSWLIRYVHCARLSLTLEAILLSWLN